ncbi:CBS domain-containing protein [Rhodobacterales bacterium HKCCE2091]|nr:CBS domain-containing protein [Rhodobacterales bacterium HKCCE2091]
MPERPIGDILAATHPYDTLTPADRADLAAKVARDRVDGGTEIQRIGTEQTALYLILSGRVEVTDETGETVSILGPGNSFGERGLMRDGRVARNAHATEPTELLSIPADAFRALVDSHAAIRRFFDRARKPAAARRDLGTLRLSEAMTPGPLTCPPDTPLQEAARMMRDARVSCIIVTEADRVRGIVTTRDLTNKALAEALPPETPVSAVMTPDPVALPPSALISDVLHAMVERGITHMPVIEAGTLVGILTQTDLTRVLATSSAALIEDIVRAPDAEALARSTARIPDLLVQLVGANNAHQVVTRLITDVGDAVTRRLLALAEAELGPPPARYLWLACGSQGRQEQTGVSDQDNCMILSDDATEADDAYFAALAKFVSDGLDRAGYFYCPGDMMATNPRWRQPKSVWQRYFRGWIDKPDPMAQMLASVMFDLRPIGGDVTLFSDLQAETLAAASKNSIFVAHMVSNSLKHTPPLGMFRGFATVRAGEHKNEIDLKHNGVVPVVDLGRVYALTGQLTAVNTRARLEAAIAAGAVSLSGGRDLIDAYDLIAETRLAHQAQEIRRGEKPDNFMAPSGLSDFERAHLRDAFVVIKTMQSAAGSRGGPLG